MNSKITKKYFIEIFQKATRTTNSSFRIFFLVMANFTAVNPLLSSKAYLQKNQDFTCASESFRVNNYKTSLSVTLAHYIKTFGRFTMAIYSIIKTYLNQGYNWLSKISFINIQKTISFFFNKSFRLIEEMALLFSLKVLKFKYTNQYKHIS